MSKEHPTPWKVNYCEVPGCEPNYYEDRPILDANGKHVIETDWGDYPPDKATVEEIVAAVNAYNRPRRVCDRLYDADEAAKALCQHFAKLGMMAPQAPFWIARCTMFLFAEDDGKKGGE